MKTTEEKVEMLLKAHERLNNHFNNLNEKYEDLKDLAVKLAEWVSDIEKTIPLRSDEMKVGRTYIKEIDRIVDSESVVWNGKPFVNYEIKLKDHPEIYKIFCSKDIPLQSGNDLQFTLDEGSCLRKIKIKSW
jgi:hypothetical protein